MKWTQEAEAAIKKVPFFVRNRVRIRVEKEARDIGRIAVTIDDVKATQARYLSKMDAEIKGYQVDICFGPNGCPNRANSAEPLLKEIEVLLAEQDLLGFLKQNVKGELKYHHEFRITLADCPNACSQPQIKDIGIIGAAVPVQTASECTRCQACVEVCKEDALVFGETDEAPAIQFERCLRCGQCISVCPSGTLSEGRRGYRVQLGGKLGRHPQLARELPGIYRQDDVLNIVRDCIDFYKKNSRHGRRFADIFGPADFQSFAKRYGRAF